jgi:hypothetical protein
LGPGGRPCCDHRSHGGQAATAAAAASVLHVQPRGGWARRCRGGRVHVPSRHRQDTPPVRAGLPASGCARVPRAPQHRPAAIAAAPRTAVPRTVASPPSPPELPPVRAPGRVGRVRCCVRWHCVSEALPGWSTRSVPAACRRLPGHLQRAGIGGAGLLPHLRPLLRDVRGYQTHLGGRRRGAPRGEHAGRLVRRGGRVPLPRPDGERQTEAVRRRHPPPPPRPSAAPHPGPGSLVARTGVRRGPAG